MNNKVIIDTHLIDEILLEVLIQSCYSNEDKKIDNMCLSAYEDACDYLTERGYLQALNGRIYTLTKKLPNSPQNHTTGSVKGEILTAGDTSSVKKKGCGKKVYGGCPNLRICGKEGYFCDECKKSVKQEHGK